jgi:hypothetical protein
LSGLAALAAAVTLAAHPAAYVSSDAQFAAAVAARSFSGGTIVLAPGSYGELVVPARSSALLRVVGSRRVHVERLLLEGTQHVSIGPLTITPSTQDASVEIDASAHVDLHDLLVTAQGTTHTASVVVPDSRDVKIRRSVFTHCGDRSVEWANCLLLWRFSHDVTVEDDWFHDCLGCDFIHGRFGSGLVIRRNRFERALPCRIGRRRCGHQDLIELFAGRGLRVEANRFGVYERGGAQLYLTGHTDDVAIVNNVFLGTDPRVPGYRAHIGMVVGSRGPRRLGLPRDVRIVNNTILTGAHRSDGYLGSLRMSSRYSTLPRRDRPLVANNVIGVLDNVWPVCRVVRASVSNVVVKGVTCSASDTSGPVNLDARGRTTADSTLVIDAASRRYAPKTDLSGRRRDTRPDIGAYEYSRRE